MSSANPKVPLQNDSINCSDIWAIRLINALTVESFYKAISAFRKAERA